MWRGRMMLIIGALLQLAHLGAAGVTTDIAGKISTAADGVNPIPLAPGSVIEVVLTSAAGEQIRTFADKEGSFVLRGVPPGVHVISPYNTAFVYPEVRVDVGPGGAVERAAYVFNGAQIPASPLVIRPAGAAQYYEQRRPLDVVGFIKTPYGLMIAFSVFAMVVMPMMKVDPEEYREAMAQLRGEPEPAAGGGGQQGGGGGGQQRLLQQQQGPPMGMQRRQIRDR